MSTNSVTSSGIAEQIVPTGKDLLITAGMLIAVTGLGMCFGSLGFTESNIITVYILGVLLSAILTRSHFCSLISSLCSVLLFNYFFTEPRLTFHAYEPGYSVTFVIMLIAALLTGSLAYRLKDNARESARSAFRTKVLFDTNQLLQKSRTFDDVLQVMANQVILLLDKDLLIYPVEDGKLGPGYVYAKDSEGDNTLCMDNSEAEVVQWVFENKKKAYELFKLAATKGNSKAYNDLANMYFLGEVVEQNYAQAFKYYAQAAKLGEDAASFNLAECYFYGTGIRVDRKN